MKTSPSKLIDEIHIALGNLEDHYHSQIPGYDASMDGYGNNRRIKILSSLRTLQKFLKDNNLIESEIEVAKITLW